MNGYLNVGCACACNKCGGFAAIESMVKAS